MRDPRKTTDRSKEGYPVGETHSGALGRSRLDNKRLESKNYFTCTLFYWN